MRKKPLSYRPSQDNIFSWEIWGWHCFNLAMILGNFEIQIIKWHPDSDPEKDIS